MDSFSFEGVSEQAPSGKSAIEVLITVTGRERYNLNTLARIRNARLNSVKNFCKGFEDIHHLDARRIGLEIGPEGQGCLESIAPAAYLDKLKRNAGQEMRKALDKVHHWRRAEKEMISHIRDERIKNEALRVSREDFEVEQAQMTIEKARKVVEQTHEAIENTPQATGENQSIIESSSYDLSEKHGLKRREIWQAIDLESPLFIANEQSPEQSPDEKQQDTPCPYRRVSPKRSALDALPRTSQRRRLHSEVEKETNDGYIGDAESEADD
ncbi:hypothetical protein MMC18_000064 [Xylographa bjoerkii]|nr:hypothetical protein [Xylographa bjoerkii]